ncbi:transporter substrate-binding domain-containing protein [Microbacterium sediminis]|uniref:Solute-binding protein family 3/N-terminal domain-containing protein n=1 Tax=Microbacterium sediminis TaxID=904291 RepID=A0A1B9NA67_9MICO|nr:transporter substrate-binding domain-containing protein [Microbacterium sediminis]OCG73477.1 hypothetical protein A7J15_07230 [Microbacterium sediminis]
MRRAHVPSTRRLAAGALLATALLATGCGVQVPTDPDGTLDRITGGELRVGATAEPGLVEVTDGEPTGPLVDLVEDFAETIDAEPEWSVASEETLVTELEEGRLDLAVGGFTDQSPWVDRAGVTRGYPGIPGADGRSLVMLVPLGENAMLAELEAFLDEEVGS